MYSDWPVAGSWVAVFVWLGFLSFLVWNQNKFLKSIFPRSGERDVRKKFEEILKKVEDFGNELDKLKKALAEEDKKGLLHTQKVKLVRYNPYDDTGGDQSFSAAFLDSKGTGIVVTSLHARSGTRVFAKPVLEGKAGKYQFSEEERKAVVDAMKE